MIRWGVGNCKKKINPHTTWHGDSLAYLGQKSQLHHVSKVNLKQWPEGSKIFYFSSLLSGVGQKERTARVDSECNNASVVFTG